MNDVMLCTCPHSKGRHWNVTPKLILCRDCDCVRRVKGLDGIDPQFLSDIRARAAADNRKNFLKQQVFKKLPHTKSGWHTTMSGRSRNIQRFKRGN